MLCYFDRVVIQAREINENTLNAVPFRTDSILCPYSEGAGDILLRIARVLRRIFKSIDLSSSNSDIVRLRGQSSHGNILIFC